MKMINYLIAVPTIFLGMHIQQEIRQLVPASVLQWNYASTWL